MLRIAPKSSSNSLISILSSDKLPISWETWWPNYYQGAFWKERTRRYSTKKCRNLSISIVLRPSLAPLYSINLTSIKFRGSNLRRVERISSTSRMRILMFSGVSWSGFLRSWLPIYCAAISTAPKNRKNNGYLITGKTFGLLSWDCRWRIFFSRTCKLSQGRRWSQFARLTVLCPES